MSVSPSFRTFVLEQLGRSGLQVRGQDPGGVDALGKLLHPVRR